MTNMVIGDVENLYREYLNLSDNSWEYANRILYDMCEENPLHNDKHVIVGKIWLIGRSYAAAIERRKKEQKDEKESNDKFYYNKVAPKMLSIGRELDDRLKRLGESQGEIRDDVKDVLDTHRFLMEIFHEITGLKKRSLASKYLHFHCPEKFFIYDNRAYESVRRLVERPDKKILADIDCDPEYGDFVCRMLELKEHLDKKTDTCNTPRELDNFLLSEVMERYKESKKQG